MHTIVLIVAAILTLCIAGPAVRGTLLKAWFLAPVMILPYLLLYMAFWASDSEQLYLAPFFVMATILVGKSAARLLTMVSNTPRAAVNTSATEPTHWAPA